MSKLILPAAELIGTPLTQEELKGILAGRSTTYTCRCTLTVKGNQTSYDINGILTEPDCRKACASDCEKTEGCTNSLIEFSVKDN